MSRAAALIALFLGFAGSLARADIAEVEAQLESISIPRFKVENTPLATAVDQLRKTSNAHRPGGDRAVKFAIERRPIAGDPVLVTLDLENTTVGTIVDAIAKTTGRRVELRSDGVLFGRPEAPTPIAQADPEKLYIRSYHIPPNFISRIDAPSEPVADDPFAEAAGSSTLSFRPFAKTYFAKHGISFPDGAAIFSGGPASAITVRNTHENHLRLQAYFEGLRADSILQVRARMEIFEVDLATAATLARDKRPANEILAEIDVLVAKSAARYIAAPQLVTRSGQRAQIDNRVEVAAFAEPAGTYFSIDPVIDHEVENIELRISLSMTGRHALKLESNVTLASGQTLFLGQVAGSLADESKTAVAFISADIAPVAVDPPVPH